MKKICLIVGIFFTSPILSSSELLHCGYVKDKVNASIFFNKTYVTAKELAKDRHAGQWSGEGGPYTNHLDEVESVLRRFGISERNSTDDAKIIVSSALHDLIEETGTTKIEIAHRIDQDCADLVDSVSHDEGQSTQQIFEKALRHRLGRKLKLADRIANWESLLQTVNLPDQPNDLRAIRLKRIHRYQKEQVTLNQVFTRIAMDPVEQKMSDYLNTVAENSRAIK